MQPRRQTVPGDLRGTDDGRAPGLSLRIKALTKISAPRVSAGKRENSLRNATEEFNRRALDRLMPLVYQDLLGLARGLFAAESAGHLLEPDALINEVYLRLLGQRSVQWRNRSQFFAIAARLMRRVLIDHARRRGAAKRRAPPPLGDDAVTQPRELNLLTLDQALERLAELAPRQCSVVQLRFYCGLTLNEAARALGISLATVKLDWGKARAWLEEQFEAL